MGHEILRQQCIYFPNRQSGRMKRELGALHLYPPHLIQQSLVGSVDNPLQFYLRILVLRLFRYRLGAHQVGTKKPDAVQMHLLAVCQFLAHGV